MEFNNWFTWLISVILTGTVGSIIAYFVIRNINSIFSNFSEQRHLKKLENDTIESYRILALSESKHHQNILMHRIGNINLQNNTNIILSPICFLFVFLLYAYLKYGNIESKGIIISNYVLIIFLCLFSIYLAFSSIWRAQKKEQLEFILRKANDSDYIKKLKEKNKDFK